MEERLKSIINQWLVKGDNDLKTAAYGLEAAEPITDTICFHCQQAVEKYLKLYLISRGDEPIITHNIAILIERCARYDTSFRELAGYDFLTGYAVTLRYPDDFYMPEIEESEVALSAARHVREFVLNLVREG